MSLISFRNVPRQNLKRVKALAVLRLRFFFFNFEINVSFKVKVSASKKRRDRLRRMFSPSQKFFVRRVLKTCEAFHFYIFFTR